MGSLPVIVRYVIRFFRTAPTCPTIGRENFDGALTEGPVHRVLCSRLTDSGENNQTPYIYELRRRRKRLVRQLRRLSSEGDQVQNEHDPSPASYSMGSVASGADTAVAADAREEGIAWIRANKAGLLSESFRSRQPFEIFPVTVTAKVKALAEEYVKVSTRSLHLLHV